MKLISFTVMKWKSFLKYLLEGKTKQNKTIPVVLPKHFTDKVIFTNSTETTDKNQGNYLKFSCPGDDENDTLAKTEKVFQ